MAIEENSNGFPCGVGDARFDQFAWTRITYPEICGIITGQQKPKHVYVPSYWTAVKNLPLLSLLDHDFVLPRLTPSPGTHQTELFTINDPNVTSLLNQHIQDYNSFNGTLTLTYKLDTTDNNNSEPIQVADIIIENGCLRKIFWHTDIPHLPNQASYGILFPAQFSRQSVTQTPTGS